MNKQDFRLAFCEGLQRAVLTYSRLTGYAIETPDKFEVHAPNCAGIILLFDEVIDTVFISSGLFYKVIDLGIITSESGELQGFVRVSGHRPVVFADTIDPDDIGPFKILEPLVEGRGKESAKRD